MPHSPLSPLHHQLPTHPSLSSSHTDEFIVNTPHPLAQKYWITNGAVHARHVVVFAQLQVAGAQHGIHGILVPIRDENLKVGKGKGRAGKGKVKTGNSS